MAQITLNSVRLQIATMARPLANQSVTVRYRPSSLSDIPANYTTVTTTGILKPQNPQSNSPATFDFVNVGGVAEPIVITIPNFVPNLKYIVWVTVNCSTVGVKYEYLQFQCITPVSFDIYEPEGGQGIIVTGTDISAAEFSLTHVADGGLVFLQKVSRTQNGGNSVCVVQVPPNIQATYIDGDQYQWSFRMFAVVNGVEVSSFPLVDYCVQPLWQYPTHTCAAATNFVVAIPNLTWDVTNSSTNANVQNQIVDFKLSSASTFNGTGILPNSQLAKTVNSATVDSGSIVVNMKYDFRQRNICNTGGPTPNTAGIKQGIVFGCIEPVISTADTSSTIIINVVNTDITKAEITLKDSGGNTLAGYPATATRITQAPYANKIVYSANSLAPGDYTWSYKFIALIDGVDKLSSTVCGSYPFTVASGVTEVGGAFGDYSTQGLPDAAVIAAARIAHPTTFLVDGSGVFLDHTIDWTYLGSTQRILKVFIPADENVGLPNKVQEVSNPTNYSNIGSTGLFDYIGDYTIPGCVNGVCKYMVLQSTSPEGVVYTHPMRFYTATTTLTTPGISLQRSGNSVKVIVTGHTGDQKLIVRKGTNSGITTGVESVALTATGAGTYITEFVGLATGVQFWFDVVAQSATAMDSIAGTANILTFNRIYSIGGTVDGDGPTLSGAATLQVHFNSKAISSPNSSQDNFIIATTNRGNIAFPDDFVGTDMFISYNGVKYYGPDNTQQYKFVQGIPANINIP